VGLAVLVGLDEVTASNEFPNKAGAPLKGEDVLFGVEMFEISILLLTLVSRE